MHRRRIYSEEKAKVVAAVLRAEFIQFLAALAVLHQDDMKKKDELHQEDMKKTIEKEDLIIFFKSSWCKIVSAARN